jgi:glycosyltransferase involved in cell wall biosynthesis
MGFGTDKKLNILLISSGTPTDHSPKMALDMVKSLELGGHQVDLLLKYPVNNSPVNVLSVYSESDLYKLRIYNSINNRISRLKAIFEPEKIKPVAKYHFIERNEDTPPVKSSLILKKIQVKYDLVLVFFWQGMLTSSSILDIYNKLKVPIFLISADMFPMTGGCSYFWDCRNFENSCGKCPAISSENEDDITKKIFSYKKDVFNSINCVFLGNSWMINHAIKSKLFKNVDTIFPVINENIFKPQNKQVLKEQFKLNDKIVLFAGAVNVSEERKGFKYLVESLQLLSEKVSASVKKDIVLVIAGDSSIDLQAYFSFETLKTGQLSYDILALYYAMADIYLSPTIQDAGPMMVNQALMCGTPVVAFNIGTACDLVNDDTGYLAEYKDASDFCHGILRLLELKNEEKKTLSEKCCEASLNKSSYKAFENKILEVYVNLLDKQ